MFAIIQKRTRVARIGAVGYPYLRRAVEKRGATQDTAPLRKKNAKENSKNAGRRPAVQRQRREGRPRLMGHFVHVARAGAACRAPTEEKCKKRERESAGARALAIVLRRYVGTGPSVLRVNRIACATERQLRRPRAVIVQAPAVPKEREDGYAKHL
jgi:hypothetical protein